MVWSTASSTKPQFEKKARIMKTSLKSFAAFVVTIGISGLGTANTALANGQARAAAAAMRRAAIPAVIPQRSSRSQESHSSHPSTSTIRISTTRTSTTIAGTRELLQFPLWLLPLEFLLFQLLLPGYRPCYTPCYAPNYCCDYAPSCREYCPPVCYEEPCYRRANLLPSCPEYCGSYCYGAVTVRIGAHRYK